MPTVGDGYQNAWASSGLNTSNQVAGGITMPADGWVTGAHCIMGGYTSNPWTRLCLWSYNGTLLWDGPGFSAGTGLAQRDGSVWNQRVQGGSGLNVGFWRDPGADAQWGIDTGGQMNWGTNTVGGVPDNYSYNTGWLSGALSAWIDYVANATPNAGVWQSPTPTGNITDSNPQFSGTTPQNPADSAYDSVGTVIWKFTRTDTGQQTAWVQWSVNANISSWTRRPSDFGISLLPGVQYSTQFAYTDSWGALSPWSSGQTFTINAGPNAPTTSAPTGKQNALTGLNFTANYTHGSSLSASNVQVQVLDGAGKTVLFDSGTVAKTVANNANYTVAQWFTTGLQWGTKYQWWTRAQDTSNVWGPWSAKTTFTTDNPPDAPTLQSPPDCSIISGGSSVVLSAVVTDQDGDNLTSVIWDLYDTTLGREVTGYPATVTGTFANGSTQTKDVTAALTAGHAYQWSVKSSDGNLTGASSATRTFTYTTPPSVTVTTPTSGQVFGDATGSITITYGGSAAKAYDETFVRDTTGGKNTLVFDSGKVSGNRTSWTFPYGLLRSGHSYTVQVTVTDANGLTATSAAVPFSASWTTTNAPRMKLLVNGVDRTANWVQNNWSISQSWGRQGDTAMVTLSDEFTTTPSFNVPPLATVEIRDLNLGIVLFGGLCTRPRRTVNSPNQVDWILSCVASGTAYLGARVLTYDYSNKTADYIAKDLITQAACGVTSNNVMPGPVIPRFRGQNVSVLHALQHLCKVASTTATFGWWVDGNSDLHFGSDLQNMASPSGVSFTDKITGPATTTTGHYVTDGQTFYEWDATTLKTRVMIQGSNITRRFTEQFLGDGTTRSFRLTYPYQTNPEYAAVVVNGTQYPSSSQKGATTPWIFTQGAPGVWTLSTQPGGAPPASGATVQVTYNYTLPVVAVVQSPLGIAQASGAPNGGYWDSVIVDDTLTDLASAHARGQREVQEYGVAQERTSFRTSEAWMGWVSVGQSINFQSMGAPDQFNNWAPGINDYFLVISVRATGAPGGYRFLTITAVRI